MRFIFLDVIPIYVCRRAYGESTCDPEARSSLRGEGVRRLIQSIRRANRPGHPNNRPPNQASCTRHLRRTSSLRSAQFSWSLYR